MPYYSAEPPPCTPRAWLRVPGLSRGPGRSPGKNFWPLNVIYTQKTRAPLTYSTSFESSHRDLGALTQTTAPSVGVVTLFSALALNYYIKNGPTLSEVAQSCLDIKYGYSTPPPPPALSKSQKPGVGEAKDWARRAWLGKLQGGQLPI